MNTLTTRLHVPNYDRFDAIIIGVIVLLLIALGGVVAAGNQVGIYVIQDGYAPSGSTSSRAPIRIQFSEAMLQASVEANFQLEPEIAGTFVWPTSNTMLFDPQQPLLAGQEYKVRVGKDARAAKRDMTLESDFVWRFTVRLPRAIFLAPSDSSTKNLYVTDLETSETYPLLDSAQRIEDYAVSPDGNQIAYTVINPDRTSDIWLLDVATRMQRPVTNCVDAQCSGPSWHQDGFRLAYHRFDHNSETGLGARSSRAWLVDLNTLETDLLFANTQVLGFAPTWAPGSDWIAVFDASVPGVRLLHHTTGQQIVVESNEGNVGNWSPDGQKLVFPVLSRGAAGDLFYNVLEIVDVESESRGPLNPSETAPADDGEAKWSPDGNKIAITRRYFDERFTNSKQIYLLDWETKAVTPLVVDAGYYHSFVNWDASSQRIIFQRFPFGSSDDQVEVWYFNLNTGQLEQLSENAMFPCWLP